MKFNVEAEDSYIALIVLFVLVFLTLSTCSADDVRDVMYEDAPADTTASD